jgi:cysteine synthase A
MQGWSPDFIPKLTGDAVDAGYVDRIVPINGADALRLTRELARREGIFCGLTGGATVAGALQLCAGAPEGTTVLAMLPDTGERYLSTPMFDGIEADMDADEWAISRSTPAARFDAPAPTPAPTPAPAPAAAPSAPEPTPEVVDFVARVLADPEQPVVLFALEWCEFCWSLRKLFARCGIPYRSVDLDSTAFQRDDRGGRIRAVLRGRTGSTTIPQVFVGGEYVGGCTDTMAAFRDGRLQALLERSGVAFDATAVTDPEALLPGWILKR